MYMKSDFEEQMDTEVSTVRDLQVNPTNPPTTESDFLVQSERAFASIRRNPEAVSWGADLVLDLNTHPELIEAVSRTVGVDPRSLSIHLTVINGTLYHGVFIDRKSVV